ncbi:MAG: hypothetical protein RL220_994, partial [Bacteroidota bacterium]
MNASGGCGPYIYTWSHDPLLTGPVANDLPSGTFFVSVADQNGCTGEDFVTIVVGEPQQPLTVTTDNISLYPGGANVSCYLASDGSVSISIEGGTPGYDVAWYNEQGFEISSSEDLTGVPCGEYTLLVTDNNNCTYSEV